MILGFKCFFSPSVISTQEGHCAALAKSTDWCLPVNAELCVRPWWSVKGICVSEETVWFEASLDMGVLGSRHLFWIGWEEIWFPGFWSLSWFKGGAWKRFPEWIQMVSVHGIGPRGAINRKLHSCVVIWVDGYRKEREKNHSASKNKVITQSLCFCNPVSWHQASHYLWC